MPGTLRLDGRPPPEPLTRLGIVEDSVVGVHVMLGLGVAAFGRLPVAPDPCPDIVVHDPRAYPVPLKDESFTP
ncbi:hypothetical protein HerbRD11066_29010 [Herbidospora sp. RD11066]